MKIYTKTGDTGQTSLASGQRVSKDDSRIKAYGTIDELNSMIGMAISFLPLSQTDLQETLLTIQHHLLDIGSELSNLGTQKKQSRVIIPKVSASKVTWLEARIDALDQPLIKLTQFILPGGTQAASCLHVARTICRRAERQVVRLVKTSSINPELIRYLNRLSDLLFTAARFSNSQSGTADTLWQKGT